MGYEEIEGTKNYVLNVRLVAQRKPDRVITDFRAGADPIGSLIDGEARDLLRVTYLKPLRDAENEMTPGMRSRLAQILKAHPIFQKNSSAEKHTLESIVEEANSQIRKYFEPLPQKKIQQEGTNDTAGQITSKINEFLNDFFPEGIEPQAHVDISGEELNTILRRLELSLEKNKTGLGSLNLLYISAELLLLESSQNKGLRLALIEELEAHLHPQAQLRLINFLQKESTKGQFILTTHSTTLGASINIENLIICKDNKVFPMGPNFTNLDPKNYDFLKRFLDATKANLFFARGVIIVEGPAENILIPALAQIINRPLHRYGVSIVNVGGTAFSHYAKIFHRKDRQSIGIKVAVITDRDVKPLEWKNDNGISPTTIENDQNKKKRFVNLSDLKSIDVELFMSPNWTLEYEIALSNIYKKFYKLILWAEKIQNSKTGLPDGTVLTKVIAKAKADVEQWNSSFDKDSRKREKIAFEIYHNTLLKKEISKTMVSQLLAEYLLVSNNKADKKRDLQKYLFQSKSIEYLLNAIYHVTKPKVDGEYDSDN